ncbi:zinc finger C2HC domain-containing protein 1A [Dunckerocampus dactyliophorus]|uniref:zinc finger C2HC domain-containing protein 1A n=1 Tax=Dunckerocampus dactyliophorus TaxID=161453 RepID=UPI0024054869|nr:zinc finger C2HC domain-containing protein 1A [Dunckerocampus dactyliophorus]XP_054621335.1 zinc finger C2HC domain-containing protein 1A [Dunckerocampus dactyliophorus]
MMDNFEDGEAPPAGDLVQCNTCKRMFFPKVLEKHAKICQKSAAKRRKVFDSSRQRAQGTDIPTLKPLKPKAEPPKKPSNWRKKHDDFISAIKASKASMKAMKDGAPLPPPPPPMYDPDLIQCPYCQRRFNESAAQGHIKFCQDQAARNAIKNKSGDAKKPLRTQYKPPPPVKKANSAASTIPSASSRLPQRSGLGQTSGVPSNKASSAPPMRINTSGLTSPGSGVGMKSRAVSSGYGSVRNAAAVRGPLNKKKQDNAYIMRDDIDGEDNVGNGEVKSKFCHSCGTRYPIESAKFCCECGIRRMCI